MRLTQMSLVDKASGKCLAPKKESYETEQGALRTSDQFDVKSICSFAGCNFRYQWIYLSINIDKIKIAIKT